MDILIYDLPLYAYLFILIASILVFYSSISFSVSSSPKGKNRLKELSNMGNSDYSNAKSGLKIFLSLRFFMMKNTNLEIMLSKLDSKLKKSGLSKYINTIDYFFLKYMILIFTVIFALKFSIPSLILARTFEEFLMNNVNEFYFYTFAILGIVYGDGFVMKFLFDRKQKVVYRDLITFISLFESNVMAGDNLYYGILHGAKDMSGTLSKEFLITCKEFLTLGQNRALQRFKERLDVDEISHFIDILIDGQQNENVEFADFIQSHSDELIELKHEASKEANASLPLIITMSNLLAVISILLVIFSYVGYYFNQIAYY